MKSVLKPTLITSSIFALTACLGFLVAEDPTPMPLPQQVKVWIVDDELQEDDKNLLVQVAETFREGVHKLEGIRKKGPDREHITITITRNTGPVPNPVIPVVPIVDPVVPTPIPTPPPVAFKNFSVLIIEQEANRAKLPRSQLGVLESTAIRAYVKSRPTVAGVQPQFRQIDIDSDLSLLPQVWKEAMALPRTTVPWIVISNGVKGVSKALPSTEEETLALLKEYGGQ